MNVSILACSLMASMDVGTGFVSLFNICEDMNVTTVPIVVPNLSVFFIVEKEDSDNYNETIQVEFYNDESKLNEFNVDVAFDGKRKSKTLMNVQNVVITKLGIFDVAIAHRGSELSRYSINVALIRPAPSASSRATGVTPDAPAPPTQS